MNGRILIVEDNEPEWQLYRYALPPLNVDCDFCSSGEEALVKVHQNAYDLIFFDLGLPQRQTSRDEKPMDDVAWGEYIFKEIKRIHAGPICIVTFHRDSYPGCNALVRLRPHADACLAKVVTPDEIRMTAKRLLKLDSPDVI